MLLPRFNKTTILTLLVAVASIYWFPFWYQIFDYFFPAAQHEFLWQPFEYHAKGRGYESETHRIWTSDGYEIEFHRLWNPNVTGQRDSYPVLFGPLCFITSKHQILFNNSAPYTFADAGFDVWLLNHRGNSYGQKHAKLDEKKDRNAFYNFTFITFGEIDLPEQIYYVLKTTGQSKVFYVMYSQAVMSLVATLSKTPALQEVFAKAIAYGGASTPCHGEDPDLIESVPWFGDLLLYAGVGHGGRFGGLLVRLPALSSFIIKFIGMNMATLNDSQIPMLFEFFDEGVLVKSMILMAQNAQAGCDGKLREFDYDYGKTTRLLMRLGLRGSRNMEVYGSREPPIVGIEKFSFPIKFYYSDGDRWASKKAILEFTERMKIPADDIHRIASKKFDHFNFHLFAGKLHHIHHAVDFFRGTPSTWNPHVFDDFFEP